MSRGEGEGRSRGEGEGRSRGEGEKGRKGDSLLLSFRFLPILGQRPSGAGCVGHGATKLPAVGVQFGEDALGQRCFTVE
jgi:hypothetical protein